MPKQTRIELRIEESQAENWRKAAESQDLTLSDWIRQSCENAINGTVRTKNTGSIQEQHIHKSTTKPTEPKPKPAKSTSNSISRHPTELPDRLKSIANLCSTCQLLGPTPDCHYCKQLNSN